LYWRLSHPLGLALSTLGVVWLALSVGMPATNGPGQAKCSTPLPPRGRACATLGFRDQHHCHLRHLGALSAQGSSAPAENVGGAALRGGPVHRLVTRTQCMDGLLTA
jgi:hypothetical protein